MRIRVLELLNVREHAVSELLAAVEVEPANLSQQLAVLRRAGLVTTRKEGSAVPYSVASPQVSELMAVARSILSGMLSGQIELLEDLRTSWAAVPHPAGTPSRPSRATAPCEQGDVVLHLWQKIRRTGRVAQPPPAARSGPRPDVAVQLGGSVQIRHVDAGSCNGCEVEIGSAFGPASARNRASRAGS